MAEVLEIDGISIRGPHMGAVTREGRYSLPQRRGNNLVMPGSSGAKFVANKPFEEGSGTLRCWVTGSVYDPVSGTRAVPSTYEGMRQAFETNIQTMMRFFTQPHKLSTIKAGQPGGFMRQAQVEWREWSEPEIQAGATRAEWSIGYTIPSVWWEDVTVTQQSAVAGATLPKTLDLTSFVGMTGIIEDAVLTVTGPITNPRITDLETGTWVQYSGTVAAGISWVVDVGNFTSTLGLGSALSNTVHYGAYRFLPIPNVYNGTSTPRLVLSGSSGGANTNLTVSARRKWATG